MKKPMILLLSSILLIGVTSCGKTDIIKLPKIDNVDGRLALLTSLEDLYRLTDTKENFVLAVLSSTDSSSTTSSALRDYVRLTSAVIYTITLNNYTQADTFLKLPRISESNAPAIIYFKEGHASSFITKKNDPNVFSSKKSIIAHLEKQTDVSSNYIFCETSKISDKEYYFYLDTDNLLRQYIYSPTATEARKKNIVAVFYDSTSERDMKFVYNDLQKSSSRDNGIKYLLINVALTKYKHDTVAHTLTSNLESYKKYAEGYNFGNYKKGISNSIPTTPAINYYELGGLKKSLIFGFENLKDEQGAFEVYKSSSAITSWLHTNVVIN